MLVHCLRIGYLFRRNRGRLRSIFSTPLSRVSLPSAVVSVLAAAKSQSFDGGIGLSPGRESCGESNHSANQKNCSSCRQVTILLYLAKSLVGNLEVDVFPQDKITRRCLVERRKLFTIYALWDPVGHIVGTV